MSDFVDSDSTTEYHVCTEVEIAERECVIVKAAGREIGIYRVNGQLRAYENRCLHQGGPVCRGDVLGRWTEELDDLKRLVGGHFAEDEPTVSCPWHGWTYDLRTGENIANRALALPSFEVVVREGEVVLRVPDEVAAP